MTATMTEDPKTEAQGNGAPAQLPATMPPAIPPLGKAAQLRSIDDGQFSNLLDTAKFEHLWRVASLFAKSQMVPEHFQGKPENCFVALQMAVRLQVDPFMFMQNTYVVHGKPGMEAKLAIALVNARGPFHGPIQWQYRGEGDDRQCTAYATHKQTGQRCEATVTMKMVKAEGWISNKKWFSLQDLMFAYRSATFLARLYAPECLMGMQTREELDDISPSRFVESRSVVADPGGEAPADLGAQLKAKAEAARDANGKPADATPADAGKEPGALPAEPKTEGAPPPGETKVEIDGAAEAQALIETLVAKCKCSAEKAGKKLKSWSGELFQQDLDRLTAEQYAKMRDLIEKGQIVVTK